MDGWNERRLRSFAAKKWAKRGAATISASTAGENFAKLPELLSRPPPISEA
jgi:hypothetical protein